MCSHRLYYYETVLNLACTLRLGSKKATFCCPVRTKKLTCALPASIGVSIHLSLRPSLFNAGLAARSFVKVCSNMHDFWLQQKPDNFASERTFRRGFGLDVYAGQHDLRRGVER